MKNMGVAGPDSSNEVAKSGALPATYWLPSFSSTKSLPGKKYTHVYPSQNCETGRPTDLAGCTQGHGLGS